MAKRPKNLIYANAERPLLHTLLVLALQHAALSVIFLIYAVLVAKGVGLATEQQQSLVTATLLACGSGAILQAASRRIGSGLLLIPIASMVFVPIGIQAGLAGGVGAIAAITLTAGVIHLLLGRSIRVFRRFFPPEVCGVVVLMLGVSLIPSALQRIVGTTLGATFAEVDLVALLVSGSTLLTIAVVSVWFKGSMRFFAMLFGCGAGIATAALAGRLGNFGGSISAAPLFSMPHVSLPWAVPDLTILPVIALLALVAAVDDMGVLISTDRLDDAEWRRPNMKQVVKGIQSAGLTNMFSGVLGGTVTSFSSSNLGLAFATGVTSRVVGIATGAMLVVAAFFPKLVAFVLAMPEPVVGGILAYAAAYFIVAGAELALSRMMSQRRMLVIGLSMTAGLSVLAAPELFGSLPGGAGLIFGSPLALAAMLAIVLNAAMRIGIAQSFKTTWHIGQPCHAPLSETLNELGERWGLHRDTVSQATISLNELMEVVAGLANGMVELEFRSDELHFDLRLSYEGDAVIVPDQAPTPEEMLDDPHAVARMSGWILRHLAGRAVTFQQAGKQGVLLRFEV